MSQWSALDFLFGAIILISTGLAVYKGLVRELISLGALVLGFILAVLNYSRIGAWFADLTSSRSIADFLGFMIIFIGCLVLGGLAAFVAKRFVKMASLDWADRALGGVFGLLRGCALASIIVLALVAFPVRESWLAQSRLSPYLMAVARGAALVIPGDMKAKFYEGYQRVLAELNKATETK